VKLRREILDAVRALPSGAVVGYGDVARACGTIPLLVGKTLAACGADVPWQRVIGSDGTLRTARRGSAYAARQRALLEKEGVTFDADGRVPPDDPAWERGFSAMRAWGRRAAEGKAISPAERGDIGGNPPSLRQRPPAGRGRRGEHDGVKNE
jgi:methylated-DNA-protein-cysteine methyltransferase-like protein